jgi:hypothetical protein
MTRTASSMLSLGLSVRGLEVMHCETLVVHGTSPPATERRMSRSVMIPWRVPPFVINADPTERSIII